MKIKRNAIDVGTGPNQIIALDGNSKLPAVDARQLLHVNRVSNVFPEDPQQGLIVYRTDLELLYIWTGSVWKAVDVPVASTGVHNVLLETLTVDGTPTELTGFDVVTNTPISLTLPAQGNTVWSYDILVQAASIATADMASFHFRGAVKYQQSSNMASFIGTPLKQSYSDTVAYDATLALDSPTRQLKILVTGDQTSTMKWTANVRLGESNYTGG